jgi:hypothetical protein
MVRIQVTLYWFTFSQEIRAIILIWIVVDAVFLAAVISGMSVRLFLDPRKFMASIGKRIFSISTYPSQIGWLKFIFKFTFNIVYVHAFTYLALLKYMIINCIVLELLIPVILNRYYLTKLQGPKYVNSRKSYSLLSRKTVCHCNEEYSTQLFYSSDRKFLP